MTRKDYQLIAEVLKKFTAEDGNVVERDAMAYDLADALGADNPRFDREKFLVAASVWESCDSCGRAMRYSTSGGKWCGAHLPEWAKKVKGLA